MLIEIPKSYRKTRGKLSSPIRYLCGNEANLLPDELAIFHELNLFDHTETFVDRRTHERIFVSHPYSTTESALRKLEAVLSKSDLMMTHFPDSWYHENTCRIELRNAIVHDHIANGGGVLKYGKRLRLCG